MEYWHWETLGVVFSLLFVFLNAREKIISWPFGILSAVVYIYIFFSTKLYGDSILQFYYLLIGIYGWYSWGKQKSQSTSFPVKIMARTRLLVWLIIGLLLTPIFGYYLDRWTDSDVPYLDGGTTVFSFLATWMMTRKILQNWLVWIVVDFASMGLYIYKELYLTAGLFLGYSMMAIYGYFNWKKQLIK